MQGIVYAHLGSRASRLSGLKGALRDCTLLSSMVWRCPSILSDIGEGQSMLATCVTAIITSNTNHVVLR